MAYKRTKWQDHVVERPRTYTKVTNGDGSETYTPAPGEVLQQGTPQSALNFNNLEEGMLHLSVAFDMLQSITQAQIREKDERIAALEEKAAALAAESSLEGGGA